MKTIIYQIFTRLWNKEGENVYNGNLKQNGCGKMNDFTTESLKRIKELGVTHIWFTGLIEHATTTNYSKFGIARDHSAMVKGKAGSPYAIKDYYDIDPDLAVCTEKRMEEFEALVQRTHDAGLKMVIDFVPNHVAREYHSDHLPQGTTDLGAEDNRNQAFCPTNNFYYIPNNSLHCTFDMKGDEPQPYQEEPARATGNDCFTASPGKNDWYETVKLNYGIDYVGGGTKRFEPRPSTWDKMRDILLFWAGKGVDAFRCDMAEMVPCEFWEWAVSQVKDSYPNILFIGEVYNPQLYRNYIYHGGFDFLYDKVGLYDTLRAITEGHQSAACITHRWQEVSDIQSHMLNFLENHDEQRLASDFFAGNGTNGKAALVVAATMNTNPVMIYFGQEFGERGMDQEGFSGKDGRTTIFDYWSVKTIREWLNINMNTAKLKSENRKIYSFYKKVLNLSLKEKAISEGMFFDLMYVNYDNTAFDSEHVYAYIRKAGNTAIFIVANFSNEKKEVDTIVPEHAFDYLQINEGEYVATDLLTNKKQSISLQKDHPFKTVVAPYSAVLLKVKGF